MEFELSSNVTTRCLKILLWGPYASRKTETGLRYFPHPFLIDTEGNSDQCIGVPEIKPFLRRVTKDVYEIMEIMDAIAAGKIKYPDGSPVETLIIDSATILWSVRQEVGALNAERRALKRSHGAEVDPDSVKMIQLDWVVAKRPLKRLNARLNASGIKYMILTARDKDLYREAKTGDTTELIKEGTTVDAMRGMEFEVNVAFQMFNTLPWKCKVTKVQGVLGSMFPLGTELPEFPHEQLLAYATGSGTATIDEQEQAQKDLEKEAQRTQADLLTLGRNMGLEAKDVAAKLKAAGFERFDAEKWEEMVLAIS